MALTRKQKAWRMADAIVEQFRRTIKKTATTCERKTNNEGLMVAAHAMACFHSMMAMLAYGKKLKGYYPHMKNNFDVDQHPGIVRGLAEEACMVMGEYFSDHDPYFQYEVHLIRHPRG